MSEKRTFYRSNPGLRQPLWRVLLVLACLLLGSLPVEARVSGSSGLIPPEAVRDLAEIRRTRQLRVLINQSRHSAGVVRDEVIGVEYQRLQDFVTYLNRDVEAERRVELRLIPLPKGELLPALARGEGDLVLPGERLPVRSGLPVRASVALQRGVPLVVVSHKGSRPIRTLAQLSGRSLALSGGSAVARMLEEVNAQLRQPLVIDWMEPSLAVEDVLELVNAGLLPLTAVELPIAERWSRLYRNLRVDRQLVLGNPAAMHWYVHRAAVNLEAQVNRYLSEPFRPPADRLLPVFSKAYALQNLLGQVERQRLQRVLPTLMLKAKSHRLEWPLLAAIGYKESTLDPQARGRKGASGLMQVTPVAAEAVGLPMPRSMTDNVEVAARYLALLRREYFSGSPINERERTAFMLVAYNLGISKVQSLRARARERGLNPDRWYFHVERVAAEEYGLQVTGYVSSVSKYQLVYERERYRLEP